MAPSTAMTLTGWARAFAIVVGIAAIILAIVVLADPALGLATLVILLAIAFLFIGIDRLISGVTGHPYSMMMPMVPPSGTAPATKPPQ